VEEGVVFFYNPPGTTAIDTIRILNNEFRQNGGSGLVFGSTVGAIGRRGLDRNVVIDGNTFDLNVQADNNNFPIGSWAELQRSTREHPLLQHRDDRAGWHS
jgi:hypothetical protein